MWANQIHVSLEGMNEREKAPRGCPAVCLGNLEVQWTVEQGTNDYVSGQGWVGPSAFLEGSP